MKLPPSGVAFSAAAMTAVAVLLPGATASADDSSVSYDAIASSYGFQSLYSNPSIPTGITLEGSGPVSQSSLNTLGSSKGFASLPYPGDVAVGFPSIAGGLTGLPIPPYPFYVASQHGSPQPEPVAFPGYTLTSRSLADQSQSSVEAQQANGFFSRAETVDSVGTVTAVADANFNVIQIGPALTLSGVRSEAKTVFTPDGKLTKTSSLSVGRFIASGLAIVIPPSAPAPYGGTTMAAPELSLSNGKFVVTLPFAGGTQQYDVPAKSVFDGLAAVGIKGTFHEAQSSETGIVSPTMTFETVFPAAPENPLYNGPTTVIYRIGLTSSSIQGRVDSLNTAGSGGASAVTPSGVDSVAAPAQLPDLGVDAAGVVLPPVPATVDLGIAQAGAVQAASSISNPRPSLAWFYLVLVGVAALGLLAGGVCIRSRGVRT